MKRAASRDPPQRKRQRSSLDEEDEASRHQVTAAAVGQLAPRLVHTIKTADRQHRLLNERNPYTDPPRGLDERFDASRRQPLSTACKHYWTTKRSQSLLPDTDIIDVKGAYKLTCLCQHCHWHLDLQILHKAEPCPKEGYPLHHFTNFEKAREDKEWYEGRCSGCGAMLHIAYREPFLSSEDIDLLTSETQLQRRCEIAKEKQPEREISTGAKPVLVLDALATYLGDSLVPSDQPKKIPKLNRRFVLSFGEECDELLLKLGFGDDGSHWVLPRPEPAEQSDPWAPETPRKKIEDALEEVWATQRELMRRDPSIDMKTLKGYRPNQQPFDEDVQLFLSTFQYDKSRTVRRMPTLNLEEQAWYAGLGALADFSDDLLSFGFDRQIATDAANAPYYYDCLSNVAKRKGSESLEVKMALLASEGLYGRQEVANAYKYFTLDPLQAGEYTDEYIHGVFESRIGSIASSLETEAREKLRMIGLSRGSKWLVDAAANGKSFFHSLDAQALAPSSLGRSGRRTMVHAIYRCSWSLPSGYDTNVPASIRGFLFAGIAPAISSRKNCQQEGRYLRLH